MGLAEMSGEGAGERVLIKREFRCAVIFPYVRRLMFKFRLGSKERMGTVIY